MRMWQRVTMCGSVLALMLPASALSGDDAREQMDALEAQGKVKINMAQAVEIAVKRMAGARSVGSELELEDGRPAYNVDLVANGKLTEVGIDAATGKVLEVEEEEAEAALWGFDNDQPGKVPSGWSIRQTNPTTAMAAWQVIADPSAPGKPNAMGVARTKNYDGTYNLAIAEKTSYGDLDLTVQVKAVRGDGDQGGGPIWRCKDENNYYIARFNPLESNYRVYFVQEGRRKQLRTIRVETVPGRWYTVRVTMVGNQITCYLDGKKMLEVADKTFKDAGRVGLWTKADAVTSFDDLLVRGIHENEDHGVSHRKHDVGDDD